MKAVKLCRWQAVSVVLAVDDHRLLEDPRDRRDLQRLARLDAHPKARITLVVAGEPREEEDHSLFDAQTCDWSIVVRLAPLTRTEAANYLVAKLAKVGRIEPTFTPKAITLIHGISRGIPRGIDRIASSALRLAAARQLEMVAPDVVEAVALECVGAE